MKPIYILRCDRARLAHTATTAKEAHRIADRFNASPGTKGLDLIAFVDLHGLCTNMGDFFEDADALAVEERVKG